MTESTSGLPALPEHIRIGRLGAVHGVRGEIKLYPLSDVSGRFESLKEVWWIGRAGPCLTLSIDGVRKAGPFYIIHFKGIDTPEHVSRFCHGHLALPLECRATLPKGFFFIDEILGLSVENEQGCFLGTISAVYQTGANDIYEVKNREKELLLPALKTVILKVDIGSKRMVVRIPEGLGE